MLASDPATGLSFEKAHKSKQKSFAIIEDNALTCHKLSFSCGEKDQERHRTSRQRDLGGEPSAERLGE